ncbi:putative stress-induced transcription regulator [Stackebrandtia albiflava]|uniref:Putative stress-induced transcription regulator n=1 Tax=Stackebrandtia albiflava TaxID=406432 RepID=A0A562V2G1_9ACTN|nr:CGNR zinc finger domain-containing protein [Stackebrandtia albiflava]TWJ12079.1 putative stress-induced transcription regulator [Stackebrandtia albiflava]
MISGQILTAPDGHRWHFDAGTLSLDFGYTGDFGWNEPVWEQLHEAGDLTEWLRDHVHPGVTEAGPDDLAEARRLRAAVVAAARHHVGVADADAEASAVIDVFAAGPDIPPQLVPAVPEGGWPVHSALAVVARDAVETFSGDLDRFRMCGGENCRLIFVDNSRPGRRRWCSMRRCGNRVKMQARRTRRADSTAG